MFNLYIALNLDDSSIILAFLKPSTSLVCLGARQKLMGVSAGIGLGRAPRNHFGRACLDLIPHAGDQGSDVLS